MWKIYRNFILYQPIYSLSKLKTIASNGQQSIMTWLKEEDANSKFKVGIISSRRQSDAIISLFVNGMQVEGVDGVRGEVFNHFATHFQAGAVDIP